MARKFLALVVISVLGAAVVTLGAGPGSGNGDSRPRAVSRSSVARPPTGLLGRLPLAFIENRGQTDPRAGYYIQGSATSVYFTARGLRLGLQDAEGTNQRWNLALDFVGARPTSPQGLGKTPAVVSYFKGNPRDWHAGIPTYSRVAYRNLWPGIDLIYAGGGDGLKYSFVVRPGGDPSTIRLGYRGATLGLDASARLEVSTPAGSLLDEPPTSYQTIGGRRVPVESRYSIRGSTYGFYVGPYDRVRPLVIDPALLYAGFIGGSDQDEANGVAVDASGAAYVVGRTQSADGSFPATVGPDPSYNGGLADAFVAKVTPDGAGLVYSGFIGGSGFDEATAVAVDAQGAAYVTGFTDSTESSFPVAVGPDLNSNGNEDAFVAKVDPPGTGLDYAGFIGGSLEDRGHGIAVDGAGSALVVGSAGGGTGFTALVGPDTTFNGGSTDAFVAKVNASGTGFGYAGFIGGSGFDEANGVAVDAAGSAYVIGGTGSTEGSFPVALGPDLIYNGGTNDAFVAKVNVAGSGLVYAGYVGGNDGDVGSAIAVGPDGNAFVGGRATSTEATFPVIGGPDLSFNGGYDAFVAEVSAAGTGLVYSGYIGGDDSDEVFGLALDPAGSAYVGGRTASTEATFPLIGGPDSTYGGGFYDGFVAKVAPGGTLGYSTYVGGSGDDRVHAVAVDRAGNAYLAGRTSGETFPLAGGPDLTYNGGLRDAFVAEVQTTETCKGRLVTQLGSQGNDRIAGTAGKDVVLALGGNDRINTRSGADRVCAGKGKDKPRGGGGNDLLLGEGGRDTLNGGAGKRDKCVGGPGKDTSRGCERGRV